MKKPAGCDLYVIQMAGTGDFKVGRTNDVRRRLKELQTSCPHPLRVFLHAEGKGNEERRVHRHLRGYETRGGKGEWFREEGMACIPDDLWEMVPVDVLEQSDWWKAAV